MILNEEEHQVVDPATIYEDVDDNISTLLKLSIVPKD
jgi:hypothetical protein